MVKKKRKTEKKKKKKHEKNIIQKVLLWVKTHVTLSVVSTLVVVLGSYGGHKLIWQDFFSPAKIGLYVNEMLIEENNLTTIVYLCPTSEMHKSVFQCLFPLTVRNQGTISMEDLSISIQTTIESNEMQYTSDLSTPSVKERRRFSDNSFNRPSDEHRRVIGYIPEYGSEIAKHTFPLLHPNEEYTIYEMLNINTSNYSVKDISVKDNFSFSLVYTYKNAEKTFQTGIILMICNYDNVADFIQKEFNEVENVNFIVRYDYIPALKKCVYTNKFIVIVPSVKSNHSEIKDIDLEHKMDFFQIEYKHDCQNRKLYLYDKNEHEIKKIKLNDLNEKECNRIKRLKQFIENVRFAPTK